MMYLSILKSVSYNKLYKNSANISHIHPLRTCIYVLFFQIYHKYLIYNQLFRYSPFQNSFVILYSCKFGFVIVKLNLNTSWNYIWKSKTINQKFKNLNSFLVSCLIQNFALPL